MSMLDNIKWKLYQEKKKKLLIYGLEKGLIKPYTEQVIERFRKVYYGGIPASITLLYDPVSNGYCYDRALLAASAFLDDDNYDVNIIDATVDYLKLNPKYISDDPLYADHSICKITNKTTKENLIIDTTLGLIIDEKLYNMIEKPKIRLIRTKEEIIEYLKLTEEIKEYDEYNNPYEALLILPNIEQGINNSSEIYALPELNLLQREIALYKEKINYDKVSKEVEEDKRLREENMKELEIVLSKIK